MGKIDFVVFYFNFSNIYISANIIFIRYNSFITCVWNRLCWQIPWYKIM